MSIRSVISSSSLQYWLQNNNNKHYTVEHLFVQIHLPLYVYQNQKSPVVPYSTNYKQQQQTLHSTTSVCTDPSSSLYLSESEISSSSLQLLTTNNNNKHYTVEHLFVQIHLPLYICQNQKSPVIPYGTDYKQQ